MYVFFFLGTVCLSKGVDPDFDRCMEIVEAYELAITKSLDVVCPFSIL